MVEKILFRDSGVPIQKIQKLSFHQVDLGQCKAKTLIPLHRCVSCPMLILWTGIVQVLRRKDERGKEDAVDCTSHALGNRW